MKEEIIVLPRNMPDWAIEQEDFIKKAMADLQREYNQRAEPLVKQLCELYSLFPEGVIFVRPKDETPHS